MVATAASPFNKINNVEMATANDLTHLPEGLLKVAKIALIKGGLVGIPTESQQKISSTLRGISQTSTPQ